MRFQQQGVNPLDEMIHLRLTVAEKAAIQQDAEAAGLSASAMVRGRYLGKPLIAKADHQMLNELRRLGAQVKESLEMAAVACHPATLSTSLREMNTLIDEWLHRTNSKNGFNNDEHKIELPPKKIRGDSATFKKSGPEQLDATLHVRLTMAEKSALQHDASLAGLTVSKLIRRRYFGKPVIANADTQLISELARQGGLLKHLHTQTGGAHSELTAALINKFNALIGLLSRKAAAT